MTFLSVVAKDLLDKAGNDLSGYNVVFPNKRAALFFNKALSQYSDKPIWSPTYLSIDDIFSGYSDMEKGDHIRLVIELYNSYQEVTHLNETLDDFYNWGELMLADFDDVDKHLADAQRVFTLIGNLHELDNVDYLTEEQQKVLQQFFSNFTKEHNSELKRRFLELWNKFYDIYTNYQERLRKQGIAYEGMLYRNALEKIKQQTPEGKYIFIGFNLLNDVEQQLFLILSKEGKTKFYWDYDAYFIDSKPNKVSHEAGKYIKEHLRHFSNELQYDNPIYQQFLKEKELTFISSSTDDLQVRYISEWLTPERIAAGRRTAIVLADESLLETVLHCLPPTVKHVNITTGYPLSQAPITSFVRILMIALEHGSLTLHNVNAILRHPYAKYISEKSIELHKALNERKIFYPKENDLALDEQLKRLFSPVGKSEDPTMSDRLIWAVRTIAQNIRDVADDFHNEGVFRMYTLLNRLKSIPEVTEQTSLYPRLLTQIIQSTSIPFHGEPLEGIQIMGVLETRNLDFDNLLILSCNEGCLPAKVNDSSFIPHNVRRAYNLTTVENKVGIYSYYFHRLLSRTKNATLIYNSSTEDGRTGEMSRFMLQMMAETPFDIKRATLVSGQDATPSTPKEITKTDDMVQKLLERKEFSPSALGKYLRCPISFFYQYVAGISEDDDSDEEEMDSRAFGKIFHYAAERMYKDFTGREVPRQYLEDLLKEKGNVTLKRFVDEAFRKELFQINDPKRPTPELGGLQVVNREMVIQFLLSLLHYDIRRSPFQIRALEQHINQEINVTVNGNKKTIKVGGIADRIDVCDVGGKESVRVIDYKTGVLSRKLNMSSIDDIFDSTQVKNHSNYFLQALLYSGILYDNGETKPITPALLYPHHASSDDYTPALFINKEAIEDAKIYMEDFYEGLTKLIEEILNADIPFALPSDMSRCTNCLFKKLCY